MKPSRGRLAFVIPAPSAAAFEAFFNHVTMRTRFLVYDPPRQAAAEMLEPTGIFERWAASMRFSDRGDGSCNLIYTYAIQLRPAWLEAVFGWLGNMMFARETRRRFKAMADYLQGGEA